MDAGGMESGGAAGVGAEGALDVAGLGGAAQFCLCFRIAASPKKMRLERQTQRLCAAFGDLLGLVIAALLASQRMLRYGNDGLAAAEGAAFRQIVPQQGSHLPAQTLPAAVLDAVQDLPIIAFRAEEEQRRRILHVESPR